jgi:aspartate/methionine/tyrosine aminotransferase
MLDLLITLQVEHTSSWSITARLVLAMIFLIREVGVVAIPPSVFYLDPEDGKNLVRFTFCKDEDTLRAAVERMKTKLKKK